MFVCVYAMHFSIDASYIIFHSPAREHRINLHHSCQEMQSLRDIIMYWRGARERKKQSLRSTTSLVPFSVSIFQARYLVLCARGMGRETAVLVLYDECLPCFRQTLFPPPSPSSLYICERVAFVSTLAFFSLREIKIISCMPHREKNI